MVYYAIRQKESVDTARSLLTSIDVLSISRSIPVQFPYLGEYYLDAFEIHRRNVIGLETFCAPSAGKSSQKTICFRTTIGA